MEFAKIFNSSTYGQILVKLDLNDEGDPEVRFFFQPDNLGVCSFAIGFVNSDKGETQANKCFRNADLDMAETSVKESIKSLPDIMEFNGKPL